MSIAAYRFPSDKDVDRIPALAHPVLHFNLPDELKRLRTKPSWQRGTGRSSKTLVKYPDFHIVLVLMKANTRTSRHHVDARISIHAVRGKLRLHLSDKAVEISSGGLFALDYAIPHEVEAIKESAFVLTISWPGGTKEERHSWKRPAS